MNMTHDDIGTSNNMQTADITNWTPSGGTRYDRSSSSECWSRATNASTEFLYIGSSGYKQNIQESASVQAE